MESLYLAPDVLLGGKGGHWSAFTVQVSPVGGLDIKVTYQVTT